MKKIAAVLLSFAMVWNLGLVHAAAEDNQAFLTGVYQNHEDSLELLCSIPGETGEKENFQITLGDQELPILSAVTAGEEQLPKTVYCLVDISGSMKGRMDQAKEVLRAVSSGLYAGDNLVIGRMGNQITDSAVLTNPEDMETEIDSLSYTGEDTDLYSGLLHGLKFLRQGEEVCEQKVMVVISDGCDDQGAGSTWKEAYEAVGKAGIPVYTAAIILSPADYEPAKELGSFDRNSAGGVHFPLSDDGGSQPARMTGAEMGEGIAAAMAETVHLTVDLSGVRKTQKDTWLLTAAFHGRDGRVLRDSRELSAGELVLTQEEETASSEPAPVPQPEPESESAKYLPYLVGGGLVLAAAVLALIVSSGRKRKQKEAERLKQEEAERRRLEKEQKEQQERLEREEQERREQLAREEQRRQEQREREAAERRVREEAARREMEAFNALPRLNVRMSVIGRRDAVQTIQLVKGYEMTVGRDARARIVLNAQDTRLSGIHFVMFWDGGSVYVWDGQSRNGTAVNGVVVNHLGRVAVKPGDSIRAGSYEYRLYWEE